MNGGLGRIRQYGRLVTRKHDQGRPETLQFRAAEPMWKRTDYLYCHKPSLENKQKPELPRYCYVNPFVLLVENISQLCFLAIR